MTDLDLLYMPATEAIRRFKAKTLSPVELMTATIARAEAMQGPVNALTFTHFDEAMDLARKAEAKYARGARTGALEGLPIGIKDENSITGKPTSSGSLILKDHVATETSVNNERILAAGGIVHARTATPEFSSAGICWSHLWGVTRNPWNRDFTPGGSSGGAAASLATGTSMLATGSDIGGSIRIPASACGVVGYKPPYGRNADDPPFNLDFYCHTGPLARTVKDALLLQNTITGPHPRDITTLRPKLTLPFAMKPAKGMKIAFSMDLGIFEVDGEVQRNTLNALQVFRDLGAEVTEIDTGFPRAALHSGLDYLAHIFGAYLAPLLAEHADKMTPYCRHLAELGLKSKATDFVASLEMAAAMYSGFGPVLENYDVLICPTLALPAVPAEFDSTRDTVLINGQTVDPFLGWAMTLPFNMLSRLPVLAVPSGHAANGVPTGIQIVGRSYCDADVFRAGLAYEAAVGGWFGTAATRPAI